MENNKAPETKRHKTDLSDLLHSYIERWPLFLISVIAFSILGAVFCYIRQPRYEVQANVLITDDDKESDLMRAAGLSDLFSTSASADGELEIIKSFTLYRNVVKELGLNTKYIVRANILKRYEVFDNSPMRLTSPSEMCDTLIGFLHFKVRIDEKGLGSVRVYNLMKDNIFEKSDLSFPATLDTPYGEFHLETTADFKAGKKLAMSIWLFGYDVAAENLQKEVRCFIPNKKSDVITVSYLAANVAEGKKIVNEIVDEYNDRGIEQNRKKARKIADFIDNRLITLSSDLTATELDVEEYKKKNNLTDLQADAQYLMSKRGAVEGRLLEAETSLAVLELTKQMLSDPNERDAMIPIPPALAESEEIIGDYNKMILRRIQLEKTAKPGNASLADLNDKIEAFRKNIFLSLDKAIATAQLQLSEIKSTNTQSQARLSQVPRQEREFLDIARQQEIKQSLYLFMLREREQTNMRIANALPKGQIIDRAFAKTRPSGMGRGKLMMLFAFIGVCAVPVLLYLRDLFRNHINTAAELQKLTPLPVIAQIPLMKDSTAAERNEQFIALATSLKFNGGKADKLSVAVTAPAKGQGATFTATNLASAYVAMGYTAVVLELNFRHPSLGGTKSSGSANLLASGIDSLDKAIIHNPTGEGYDVIAAETAITNPALTLASQNQKLLIDKLSAMYNYVIVDAASIDNPADVISIASNCDTTIVVVRANVTRLSEIRRINSFVSDSSIQNVELVVDGTKPARKIMGITI